MPATDNTPLPTTGEAVRMVVLAISPRYARALRGILAGVDVEEDVAALMIPDLCEEITDQLESPAPGDGPQRRAKGLDDYRSPKRTKSPAEQIAEKMAADALASTDDKK